MFQVRFQPAIKQHSVGLNRERPLQLAYVLKFCVKINIVNSNTHIPLPLALARIKIHL